MSWSEDIVLDRPLADVVPVAAARGATVDLWRAGIYREGYDAATESLERVYSTQVLELRQEIEAMRDGVLETLECAVEAGLESVRGALPELVMAVVRRVLGEIELDAAQVGRMIARAIPEYLESDAHLVVILSEHDFELMDRSALQTLTGGRALKLERDPSLEPGDFRIQSPVGRLDGTLEGRLNRAASELKEDAG